MATDEQKAIRLVLEALRNEGTEWLRRSELDKASKATGALKTAMGRYEVLAANELERLLSYGGPIGSFDDTDVVFLKPPAKEEAAAAALWCRWDCRETPSKFGFYFGLWSSQAAFPKATDGSAHERHTAFVGYRFETPEEGDNHDYYHAQPCRSMGRKDDEIEVALPISNRAPTWPLAADGALELLLCLVTALYGMEGLRALRNTLLADASARRIGLLRDGFDRILGLKRSKAA